MKRVWGDLILLNNSSFLDQNSPDLDGEVKIEFENLDRSKKSIRQNQIDYLKSF